MYSSTTDGRTVIKIGGQPISGDRAAPLYSVPIKTTATFNIQLGSLIQNGAANVGTNSSIGDTSSSASGRGSSNIGTSTYDDDVRNGRIGSSGNDPNDVDGGINGDRAGVGRSESCFTSTADDIDDLYGSQNRRGSNSSNFSGNSQDLPQYSPPLNITSNGVSGSGVSGFGVAGSGDAGYGVSGVSGSGDAGSGISTDSGGAVGVSFLDDNKSSCSSDYGQEGEENTSSSFNFIGWDVGNDERQPPMPCRRVLMWKDSEMALMFKACCTTEEVGRSPKLLALMGDIADNCVKRLKKMKDMTLSNLHAQHLDTLPLSDGRLTKEHIDALSANVGETVTIADVAFRFQPPEGVYLGTYVQGTVLEKRNYAIGKIGVMVILQKKSKFATVEAFSEQLCQHIAITKPSTLGTVKLGKNSSITALEHLQRDQLLLQKFTFDQTIIVAEAARRSFVKIEDFLIFK